MSITLLSPMRKIREILLNEYIGAIAIGFLLAQTAGGFINLVISPVAFYWNSRNQSHSIFGGDEQTFGWHTLLIPATSVFLHFLIALLLFYWLYLWKPKRPAEQELTENAGQFE